MPIGCQARSSPSVRLSQARVLAKMPESAKHSCGTLVRGRGEDKLGMMCLCQRGRWICASFPLASAQTGLTEHCSEAVRDPGMPPQPYSLWGSFTKAVTKVYGPFPHITLVIHVLHAFITCTQLRLP